MFIFLSPPKIVDALKIGILCNNSLLSLALMHYLACGMTSKYLLKKNNKIKRNITELINRFQYSTQSNRVCIDIILLYK